MHVVHGTWIPDDTAEFVQRGGLWLTGWRRTRRHPLAVVGVVRTPSTLDT